MVQWTRDNLSYCIHIHDVNVLIVQCTFERIHHIRNSNYTSKPGIYKDTEQTPLEPSQHWNLHRDKM